jgi:hypothetical protein
MSLIFRGAGTWVALLLGAVPLLSAQSPNALAVLADHLKLENALRKAEVMAYAKSSGIPVRQELPGGRIIELQQIENNIPKFYTTLNEDAGITTRADKLWSAPYGVTGSSYDRLGVWDAAGVRTTHQELVGRVVQVDAPSGTHRHATHVAGTLIASGIEARAKGMAPEATLKAYDWDGDFDEMALAASGGMEISSHSYGYITGWDGSGSWYGDTTISQNESYGFGFYGEGARRYDEIAHAAPYYLIVKAAGNDRNDDAPSPGAAHSHNGSGNYTDTHYSDGHDDGGYDTISWVGNAKNILTVGAVDDVPVYGNALQVVMSSFSGWGPTDDGRIKPDIVGNGIRLYSTGDAYDSFYYTSSGTSMATPNVAGTLTLLQELYQRTHDGRSMRSSTLKALALHTADAAGDYDGPDYRFGWGLLNAQRAAALISRDRASTLIDEVTLAEAQSYTRMIRLAPDALEPIRVTIAWTDPPGTSPAPSLDPTDRMLVNDLDLKITKDGVTYYPWTLDGANPSAPAAQDKKNWVDNVEQVFISMPEEGTYTITVDHDGALSEGFQTFSIILDTPQKRRIQGTQEYVEGVAQDSSGHYLPRCDAGYRLVQGFDACVMADTLASSGLSLPSCSPDERLVQGTNLCEAVMSK